MTFAKRRQINFPDGAVFRTPILLPSFSSKGFPDVGQIFKASEEYISDEILVSAYDVGHGFLKGPFDFASMIFLDSGGYEASKDTDMSETYENNYVANTWTREQHQSVLDGWHSNSPTVFVTYDNQGQRSTISKQLEDGQALRIPEGGIKNFLIKPESPTGTRLDMKSVLSSVKHMDAFPIIGVTEKEIGNSLLSRMINIAKIRRALDKLEMNSVIHVFGSLDTLSTYLFFLAGADVFDGLTWLRYAFYDGDTIYRHNYGALALPIKTNSDIVEGRCWSNNYQYMVQMQLNMGKYINDGDFRHFGKHSALIESAFKTMNSELEG